MISRWILLSVCSCLFIVNAPRAVEGRYAIVPRQQSPSPTDQQAPSTVSPSPNADSVKASAKADQTAAPSAAASSSLGTTLDKSRATPSAQGSSTSNAKASTSSSSDPAVLTATPIGNSSLILPSDTAQKGTEDLPITPTVTPALAVAGAFLMLTGIFYTLIGIKTKWLHIFLSTAYLTSLATTVLIVYVMHPPVSNAIQGAYFVAAFVTGVIFGGGSVIFTDVTEGLGCLLGGYCLAMWFLVLTPGGLIRSTAGKAIFIACFTVGAFGFYLSHWTRAYGLIGSISFAGATVIVLGIDCFSRAGLKEFWLYIWGLNDDLFPLRYSGPYPMTRGIRVEIAAIIIIFLVGLMSQMKIWKIIKQRREERAAERSKREQLDDRAEENVGKTVEEGNNRDRNLWEAAYGRKKGADRHMDSGIGTEPPSVRKASLSIVGTNDAVNSRPESIELNDLERGSARIEHESRSGGKGKARATVTIRVASDDDVVRSDCSSASTNNGCEARDVALDGPSSRAGKNKASASPDVVPLPFKVPDPDSGDDKRSSVGASMASDHFSTRVLKRLSGGSLKRTSSKRSQRSYMATSTSEEALMIPYGDDDDRASSVEAAVDDISDGNRSEADEADEADGTTLAGLPSPSADGLLKFSPPTEPHPMERPERKISKMSLGQSSSRSAQAREGPTTENRIEDSEVVVDHPPRTQHANLESDVSDPTSKPQDPPNTSTSGTPPNDEQPTEKPALRDSLANLDGTSKVVMAYRTNEWAKHLDRAEKPSLDDLRSIRAAAEKPAPLNIPALQQTPLNASPAPALPNLNTSPHVSRSASSNSQDSLSQLSPLNQHRSSSQTSLDSLPSQQAARAHQARRISSSSAHHNPQAPHRVSRGLASTPITNTPIDEDIPSTTFPQRSSFTQPPLPTSNTLMSRRESLLQSRPSSTSLTRGAAYTPLSRTSSPKILNGGDDIPLSHRRVSLQQQYQQQRRSFSPQMVPSPSAAAASAYPYPAPLNINSSHSHSPAQQPSAYPFPSPSPSPSPSSPLNLRASAHLKGDQGLHNRHSDLLIQKRRSETQNQQATVAKRNSEREMDARWRASGAGMEERHREAMRRMQAGVGG